MTEHKRPLKRGFAMKTILALAVEKAILMAQIDSKTVYDPLQELTKDNMPAGGYVAVASRLRYEHDLHRVQFAMSAAPVGDSEAMIRRMEWLQSDHFNPREPSPAIA